MPAHRKLSRRVKRDLKSTRVSHGSAGFPPLPWADIIEGSADLIGLTDPQGRLTFLNESGRKMAGLTLREDIRGRSLVGQYTAQSATLILKTALPVARREGTWSGETILRDAKGRETSLYQVIGVHKDSKGQVLGYATLAHDISARRIAEESAQAKDQALQRQARLLDLAHDAIIVREFDGLILYWNEGATSKYGWAKEDAIGKITHTLLRTRFPESREATDRTLLADGFWEGELVHTRRDGDQINVASRQILDRKCPGQHPAVLEMNRNITEQKEFERRLRASEKQLLDLTGHLLRSQDEERQRISRELHDTTSQILTGILSRLYLVKKSAQPLNEPSKQALSAALKLAEGLAEFIRIFSSSLHPSILDERGLAGAIRWYAEGITTQENIPIRVTVGPNVPRLSQTAERSLYRVAQECISRVRIRSAAKEANIRLTRLDDAFVLEIGVEGGINTATGQSNLETVVLGQGAMGMRERMRQIGGQLDVHPTDHGIVIRAVLPSSPTAGASTSDVKLA